MNRGHDYVVIGRQAALRQPFARILAQFEGALARIHEARAAAAKSEA